LYRAVYVAACALEWLARIMISTILVECSANTLGLTTRKKWCVGCNKVLAFTGNCMLANNINIDIVD